jgi:hypothetical protein
VSGTRTPVRITSTDAMSSGPNADLVERLEGLELKFRRRLNRAIIYLTNQTGNG